MITPRPASKGYPVKKSFFVWVGEHTVEYIDDVLKDCTPATYIILVTDGISMN